MDYPLDCNDNLSTSGAKKSSRLISQLSSNNSWYHKVLRECECDVNIVGKCAKRTEFWVSRDWATANTKQKIQIIPVRGVMFLPVNVMKEFYG